MEAHSERQKIVRPAATRDRPGRHDARNYPQRGKKQEGRKGARHQRKRPPRGAKCGGRKIVPIRGADRLTEDDQRIGLHKDHECRGKGVSIRTRRSKPDSVTPAIGNLGLESGKNLI